MTGAESWPRGGFPRHAIRIVDASPESLPAAARSKSRGEMVAAGRYTVTMIRRYLSITLLLLVAGCATFGPQIVVSEVSLANITPLDATLFEQRVRVDLRLRNPNDFAIDLTGVDFQLAVNGARLASGVTGEGVTLPRLGESVVSVEVTTTLLDWMRQIGNLGSVQEISYDLTGHLHIAHIGRLPFSHSGRFAPGKAPATPSPQGT